MTTSKFPYTVKLLQPAARYANALPKLLKEFFDDIDRPSVYLGVEWWGAFHRDEPEELVGFAGMLASSVEPGSMYLNRSGVLKMHRGAGLQRLLIRARLKRAKDLGADSCTSDTYDNPFSANNLIAEGFRAYRPVTPWRTEGTVYWRKHL